MRQPFGGGDKDDESWEFRAADWPSVPTEMRPKPLYVNVVLQGNDAELLKSRGWSVQDVRLMAADSDADRASVVKAVLEGVRQGSIQMSPQALKFLELESRVVGLFNQKDGPSEKAALSKNHDLETILDFAKGTTTATLSHREAKRLHDSRVKERREAGEDTTPKASPTKRQPTDDDADVPDPDTYNPEGD